MQKIPDGGVLIVRVSNGWRVLTPALEEGAAPLESVFQDQPSVPMEHADLVEAISLRDALYEAFDGWLRSKRRAGLVIEARSSWVQEDLAREAASSKPPGQGL